MSQPATATQPPTSGPPDASAQRRHAPPRRKTRPPDAMQQPRRPARPETASTVPDDPQDAAALLAGFPIAPKRCKFVLALILKSCNWSHRLKGKGVSHKTMAERARFCFWLFDFLLEQPPHYKLDPRSFSGRHVRAVTDHWRAEASAGRLKPATLRTYFSFLKTFMAWIGKSRLLPPIERCFTDPALYRTRLDTTVDRSWRGQGVDVAPLIDAVAAYDAHAGMSLRLMHGFSLRFKESVMFRPHQDVLTSEQAVKVAGRPGRQELHPGLQHLLVRRGTKGGRPRLFPIDTPQRRAIIDQARQLARHPDASMGHPDLTLVQALRRLRYCMERFGIARADLGVVPHGLRHQGAADDYRAMTGELPPVAGGQPVERERDSLARERVAARLGHNRHSISSASLGGTGRAGPAGSGDRLHGPAKTTTDSGSATCSAWTPAN